MKASVPLLKNNGKWDGAAKTLKRIADETGLPKDLYEYALFCMNQWSFTEAIDYCQKTLDQLECSTNKENEEYLALKGDVLFSMGRVYFREHKYKESEKKDLQALAIFQELAKDNPKAYNQSLANTMGLLGSVYGDTNRFPEAEKTLLSAINIYPQLAEDSTQHINVRKVLTQHNLAYMYFQIGKYEESEEMFMQVMDAQEKLFKEAPQDYGDDLAWTKTNLGALYQQTQRIEKARRQRPSKSTANIRLS